MSGWAAVADAAMDLTNSGIGLYEFNKNLRHQESMAKHQYQYAVTDMKRAGLNPILAATGGMQPAKASGGSSTTGGGKGSSGLSKNMLAAEQAKLLKATTAREVADAGLKTAQTQATDVNTAREQHRLSKEGLLDKAWKGASDLVDNAQRWFGNSARDIKNRFNYMKQDAEEAFKQPKHYIDIHPRK